MRVTNLANPVLITSETSWRQLEQYLRDDYWRLKHHHLSEKSIRLGVQHIRVFCLWWEAYFQEPFEAQRITNYDLHVYRTWSLDKEKVRAATWNSRLWALGIYALMLGREDLMADIEAKEFVRGSTRHRSLADMEYHRLVHNIEKEPQRAVTEYEYKIAIRNAAAVGLMLFAGLRVEEVSLLDEKDCSINERSGDVLVRNGKGSKERNVPLNLMARKLISAWLVCRPNQSQALICGKHGQRIDVRTLQRIVEALGKQIGVPDLTPHWLRYTFAKKLQSGSVPIETIRDLLGHSSIEITRRYLRSSSDELQAAVEVVL